jgi:coenzyme PQQ synthesis protein D (PqqD)
MNVMDRFRDLLPVQVPDVNAMRRRTYRRAPHVVWVSQRGTTILFDVNRGTYESLNDVASTVWRHLLENHRTTFDSLLEAIRAEYDVPADVSAHRVEQDVSALLIQLEKSHSIVCETGGHGASHA